MRAALRKFFMETPLSSPREFGRREIDHIVDFRQGEIGKSSSCPSRIVIVPRPSGEVPSTLGRTFLTFAEVSVTLRFAWRGRHPKDWYDHTAEGGTGDVR